MSTARRRRGLAILLVSCSCLWLYACLVPLFDDRALAAPQYRAIHGTWVIDLDATAQESLRVYFGNDDEPGRRAQAASLLLTFDTRKMKFRRTVLGKEEVRNITHIVRDQGHKWTLWLRQVKFPDYIVPLADGRLRYGSDWGTLWEFILQRGDGHAN